MNAVFYFTFWDEQTEVLTRKGFILHLEEGVDDSEKFLDQVDKMESAYGVHDCSSSPSPEVLGIGYTGYEVATKAYGALMGEWRDFFVALVGASKVSAVVDVSAELESDLEIFLEIQKQVILTCQL